MFLAWFSGTREVLVFYSSKARNDHILWRKCKVVHTTGTAFLLVVYRSFALFA